MDPSDLLDYALGQLDGPRRAEVERAIAADPALAERLALLTRRLARLLDDGQGAGPSPDPHHPRPPPIAAGPDDDGQPAPDTN
jgi:anti-sigma factor RsiW